MAESAERVPYKEGGIRLAMGKRFQVELQAPVLRARLTGLLFDTSKSFLLPSAIHGMRALRRLFDARKNLKILITGHTDRAGTDAYNLKLSSERADSMSAYLRDAVDEWMKFYGQDIAAEKRWGEHEDSLMIGQVVPAGKLEGGSPPPLTTANVEAFQRFSNETRGTSLAVDGKLGPQSRRALVDAYMKQPGTSLPDGTVPLTHGCGPFHNDVPTPPGVAEQRNRRAEIFFFEREVKPPPRKPCPGPRGCPEYPEWLKSTTKTIDLDRGVGTLTVKVQKEGGGAIEGAAVHLEGPFSDDGKTDASGVATFADLPAGSYTVSAEQDSFDDARTTAELGDGSQVEVDLALRAQLFDLDVLVQDEAKNPLRDAVVTLDVKGVDPAKTNDKGIAHFTGLQRGSVHVTAKHPGFKDGSVETPVPAAAKESSGEKAGADQPDGDGGGPVPISLSGATGGVVITVRSGTETGLTVKGATVSLQPRAGGPPLEKTVDAASEKATFTDVPAGKVLVSVEAKGFVAPAPVELDVQSGVDQGKTIVLQPAPATLVVRVVEANATPPALPARIGGATVRVLPAGSAAEQSRKTIDKSDKDHGGEAKFENLPAGKATIRVQADGFAPGQGEAVLTGGDVATAEIALRPATGTVVVLVTDDLGAKVDDANVLVTLQPPGSAKSRTAPTSNGRARFEGVPPGQSKIVAAKPGFADGEASATLQADQTVEVPVAVKRRLAGLTVTVVTPSGELLEGATVVLERGSERREGVTQASGEAPPFNDLTVGKWKLSARLDTFTAPAPEEVDLKDGAGQKRTVTLTPNAVTAAITAAAPVSLPLVVVKKKGACTPARKKITLSVKNPFVGKGTGRFTRSKETIKFFNAAGAELKFDDKENVFTAAELTAGKDLFAEGLATSASQQDTELRLELTAGGVHIGTPAAAKATCVELTVDLFQSRTVAAGDPAKMSDGDKLSVGRFVHVQDTAFHQGRAMLAVREVQPAGFGGSVRLQILGAPAGKLRLFPDEAHKPGEVSALPVVLTPAQLGAANVAGAKGFALFAEGDTVSGALRDVTLQLGLDGDEADGDRIAFTVVRFSNLQAVVPSTRSPRTGAIPDHPAFTISGAAADHFSEDFAANRPLVLLQNSVIPATPVKLTVTVQPAGVPVSWSALRDTRPAQPAVAAHANDGDDAAVVALSPNAVPTVSKTGAASANLLTDAAGSFRVRAFVNNNSSPAFDRDPATSDSFAPDPFLLLNLVLVHVRLDHDDVQNHQTLVGVALGVGGIQTRSGVFDLLNQPNNTALHHNALCTIIGGGRDGRLGTDRVFAGWLQDAVAAIGHRGTYVDNTAAPPAAHPVPIVQENPRRGAFAPGTTPNVLPGDAAIAIFPTPPPILDSGRIGAGAGGATACLGQSRITSRNNVALGEQLRIEAVDSPAVGYTAVHPAVPAARLTFFHFQMDFRAHLAFWTNNASPPNANKSGDPAERLYVVALEVPWSMLGEWDVNPATGAVTVHGPAPAVTMPGNVVHQPAVAAQGLGVEPSVATGQTTWLATWLRDATT